MVDNGARLLRREGRREGGREGWQIVEREMEG